MSLVDNLISNGYLKTPEIQDAFWKIKRIDFLPDEFKYLAEVDEALPIGKGQTISQPAVVAFMIELLEPKPGDKILDVGSGSGWTSALLAYIVSGGELNEKLKVKLKEALPLFTPHFTLGSSANEKLTGRVIAMEIIPELKEFGEKNIGRYNFIEKGIVECVCGDGSKGCPNIASRPELVEGFDKILVSAATQKECPKALKEQLKVNGRIVIPIENSIWLLIKQGFKKFEEHEYPGFVFVPLIEADTRG